MRKDFWDCTRSSVTYSSVEIERCDIYRHGSDVFSIGNVVCGVVGLSGSFSVCNGDCDGPASLCVECCAIAARLKSAGLP